MPSSDTTPLRVSECFLSLQGEGPSAGTPAHFVRLQGCDVGCHWCDSKYTWGVSGGRESTVDQVLDEARALGTAPLIVITGGEPLQHDGVYGLLKQALTRWPRVEVETSGIIRAEAFDRSHKLIKEFKIGSLRKVDGQRQLESMKIRSPKTGQDTELKFDLLKVP